LEKAAKILFGKTYILLPPANPSNQFAQTLTNFQPDLVIGKNTLLKEGIGDQQRIQQWVQELAQIKPEVTAFEDWQMILHTVLQYHKKDNGLFKIVQNPTHNSYPWVGLSKAEIDKLLTGYPPNVARYQDPYTGKPYPLKDIRSYYPPGSASTVLYMPEDLVVIKNGQPVPQYGLYITSFVEHIPDEKMMTGLSFHYNAPNAEAPQALLLATASDKTLQRGHWEVDDLNEILYDTLDLAKVRMVDLEALKEYGFVLPMTWLFNIPTVN